MIPKCICSLPSQKTTPTNLVEKKKYKESTHLDYRVGYYSMGVGQQGWVSAPWAAL